ncbi:MAG: hypothetical protein ABSD73_06565 [Candidatus Bathyarchaeia archaeon]|jgi:hypothetical protein
MKEDRVRDFVVTWLSKNDYTDIKLTASRGAPRKRREGRGRPRLNPTDPDVKARKGSAYYFIEVKGDPPLTWKIYQAVGEICTKRASTTPKICAIAFPRSFARILSKTLPLRAWEKLKIRILIVDNSGNVSEFPPSKRSFEKIQGLL